MSESETPTKEVRKNDPIVFNRENISNGNVKEASNGNILELRPLPTNEPNPYHIKYAATYGAKGKITLHVVDSTGKNVENANIQGAFYNTGKDGYNFKEQTDTFGLVTLENDCTGDLIFHVGKEGYYRTEMRYWFFKNGFDCVKDGRWMPWNPILQVTLKEKRNPSAHLIKQIDFKLPKKEIIGFDCLAGDWISPYGTGNTADILFHYDSVADSSYYLVTNTLTITTTETGGFCIMKGDTFSSFRSVYEAPHDGYKNIIECNFARTESTISVNQTIAEDEYVVFRVNRSKTIPPMYYYGKIYKFEYGESVSRKGFGYLKFTYYFNSKCNDQNLEDDGYYP
jgi:hypothetical protein